MKISKDNGRAKKYLNNFVSLYLLFIIVLYKIKNT